jgi:hypothetical protein
MPSKRARKAVPSTLIESIEPSEAIPSSEITLGEEALLQGIDELATSTLLPRAAESSYPEPLSPTNLLNLPKKRSKLRMIRIPTD